MNINRWRQFDFSLGVQNATTWLLKKPNELARGLNLRFTETVGGFERRPGFQQAGAQFSTVNAPQGGHIAKFSTGSRRFVAVNNDGDTATIIRYQDSGSGNWTTLSNIPTWPADSIMFFVDYLDEVYVTGFNPVNGDPVQPVNINKDLDVSTTRNILGMPWGYFLEEYLGLLYVANVTVGSTRYPDRVYKSSPPLGAMTYIQGNQTDVLTSTTYVDNTPSMTGASSPSGSVSASTTFTGYNAYAAFDDLGTRANSWFSASGNNTGIVTYDFGSGVTKTITHYSITALATDMDSGDPAHAPKTWTFQGSNDGSSWTTIDTQTNVAGWSSGEKRIYATSNTTAYRYYRVNVSVNQGGTIVTINEIELLTSLTGAQAIEIKLDSVRYVKAGYAIDIYKAGTNTKLYDLTVATVDKVRNVITVTPESRTFATGDVNTTTNVITIATASTFPTGTPIKFSSTSAVPAGLVAGTTYYAINVSSTTIKVATTLDNAMLGNAIDITSTGTGTHTLRMSYVFSDNDEIWLDGTKGKLNIFWNTDYPNPEQTGEYLGIKPGTDANNTISAIKASSNRLFIWTKNSGTRYDGQNLIVFNKAVGCISQRSVANIDDDWLIWVDQKGNVRARSENQGAQENISRAIRNDFMRKLTLEQLKATSAGVVDQTYKLYLGTIDGKYIRVCYDFDANTWSPEQLGYPALLHANDDYTGILRPYFFSSNGRLYQDEIGNLDDDKKIVFNAGTGRDMFQTEQRKKFYGIRLFTRNCNGLRIQGAVDGGQMQTLGRIEGEVSTIIFPENGDNVLPRGVSFDWQISGKLDGDSPKVDGAIVYWIPEEDVPSAERR